MNLEAMKEAMIQNYSENESNNENVKQSNQNGQNVSVNLQKVEQLTNELERISGWVRMEIKEMNQEMNSLNSDNKKYWEQMKDLFNQINENYKKTSLELSKVNQLVTTINQERAILTKGLSILIDQQQQGIEVKGTEMADLNFKQKMKLISIAGVSSVVGSVILTLVFILLSK